MMLKTIVVLLVAGLLTESNGAAVQRGFTDGPGFNYADQIYQLFMDAPNSALNYGKQLMGIGGTIMGTAMDGTNTASQMAKFSNMTMTFPTTTLRKLPARVTGILDMLLSETPVNVTMGASMGPDGMCTLNVLSVVPEPLNMVLNLDRLEPASNVVKNSSAMLNRLTNFFTDFLMEFLPDPLKNAVQIFTDNMPAATRESICKSIVDGAPKSPFSTA